MEIGLKGEVVILDEGHNIEDAAREAASLSLTLKQIGEAMDDLGNMSESVWTLVSCYWFNTVAQ